MSIALSSDGEARQIANGLHSLAEARRALSNGDVVLAARRLAEFRRSPIGGTTRQLESDLLELRIQALQDATRLAGRCTDLLPRHVRRDTEDRFLLGAANLIRRHLNSAAALSWLQETSDPKLLFESGRGRTAAFYLQLLREMGQLEQARSLAVAFLNDPCLENPHVSLWQESVMTLRGMHPGGAPDLQKCVSGLVEKLPPTQALRLQIIAAASRVLVASSAATDTTSADPLKTQQLALSLCRSRASLHARRRDYTNAASQLQQAHDLAVQIHGVETYESMELRLQQFEMALHGNLAQPTDTAWWTSLRSVGAELGMNSHVEHRLANILRKAGHQDLALSQYAYVASQHPRDPNGIRAAYQLAVNAEETGALDDAEARYLAIASNSVTTYGVAGLCLIGAYRCAVRQNDESLKAEVIESLQGMHTSSVSLRETLLVTRQLRDEGLGALADAALDQGLKQFQSLTSGGTLTTREYLGVTHLVVRRLYEARRYADVVAAVNGIGSSYWNNPSIAWGHLAGCLHYACLSWLVLDNPDNGTTLSNAATTALQTRPSQAAHVNLAVAEVYEKSRGWAAASKLYTQIVALAPLSTAAMKAKLRLARRAWQSGQVDVARRLAASVLLEGKLNRKDPDLAAAFWSAYGMAASQQGAAGNEDGFMYPNLSAKEAMKRQRATRIARIFRLG
jgi:tetratricopeptide (TPR) repeat protein